MTNLITRDKYLKGRDKQYSKEWNLRPELEDNMNKTISIVNAFLKDIGVDWDVQVSSGWRPQAINNATKGAAVQSNHTKCLAVDIVDIHPHPLMTLILDNLDKAEKHGVYFEDFRATASWVHIQIVAPKSGKRIFVPNSNPFQAPNKWGGIYDQK